MKHFKYAIYLVAALTMPLATASCSDDDDSGDPDERVFARIGEYKEALVGAPHGWIAEVNTGHSGVHTLWMDFSADGRVGMYFDYVEYWRELEDILHTSTYSILALQLPTLVFDTYSYMAIFADPNPLNNGSGQIGQGLIADFEYQILEYRNDEFSMVGLKNGQKATMRKATAEEKEEIANGALMENVHGAPSYQPCYYTFRYDNVNYDFISNGRKTGFLTSVSGSIVSEFKGSKIDMDKNIIMMEPLELGGYEIPYFTKTDTGYEAKVGNEVVEIKESTNPVYSLLGSITGTDRYNYFVSPGGMRSAWSREYTDRFLTSRNDFLNWSLNFYNGRGNYMTYIALHFETSRTVILEIGYQFYYTGGTLDSRVWGQLYKFRNYSRNPDGSITLSTDYIVDPINTGQDEFDDSLAPLLEYFVGQTFFVKTWPMMQGSYDTVALIPADDLTRGVIVGAVYD